MLSAVQSDLLTGFLSFLFTLLILSYLVGDNPAFRLAVNIFTGITAGYIVVVAFQAIVNLFSPMVSGSYLDRALLFFPLILSLLLLGKASSAYEWMGRPVVAFLVGVGSAAAVGGAIMGTIFPQILAVSSLFDLKQAAGFGDIALTMAGGTFVLFGTLVTLAYFQFSVFGKDKLRGNRDQVLGLIAFVGQVFIVITLGIIFSGVLAAALAALVDRMHSLVQFVFQVLLTFFARFP